MEENMQKIKAAAEAAASETFKTCPHCRIRVGGHLKKCPLCQTPLPGEGTRDYWPDLHGLKNQSLIFRILFFVLAALSILSFGTSALIRDYPGSTVVNTVLMLLIGLTFIVWYIWKCRPGLARLIFILLLGASALTSLVDRMLHWNGISVNLIFPILISTALVINFIITLLKSSLAQNSLVYLMINIMLGAMPYLALFILGKAAAHTAWTVCLLVSLITLAGLLIFRRGAFLSELQKRFHM